MQSEVSVSDKSRLTRVSNGLYYNSVRLKELKQNGGVEPKWMQLMEEFNAGEKHETRDPN